MAIEEILINIGLESKDFSNKIEGLARQYDSFLKTVTHKPIEIRFSDEGVKTLQKSLEQARQNLAKFATSIKQRFQLEFNPEVANMDQIKSLVNNKIADLQAQLDRSPLRVNIDPKIFSDAQRLLSTLEDIRKKEASGGAASPQEQERVASLLSKLQGLERIFNKGFFDKFNADSTTSGQKVDLLRTKLEQLSQLKAAQDRSNPALENLIKQLADLQKAFFSAESVLPKLRGLKEQVEGIFAQLNLLQGAKGIPQEVLNSISKLSQTIHELGNEEDELKKKELLGDKETQEFDLLLAAESADKKLQIEQNTLNQSKNLDQQNVASTQQAETAKTEAVRIGEAERAALNQAGLDAQVQQTKGATELIISRLGKAVLEFRRGDKTLETVGRISKDLTSSLNSNIDVAQELADKFNGLKVAPNSLLSKENLENNIRLQKEVKAAADDLVNSLKNLENAQGKRAEAVKLDPKIASLFSEGNAAGASALSKQKENLEQEAKAEEDKFKQSSARFLELSATAEQSQGRIVAASKRAQDAIFKDTEVITGKLKGLGEERNANELKLLNERERLNKSSLLNLNNSEELSIRKTITARENLGKKLIALENILLEQRRSIQNSAAGLTIDEDQTFRERIRAATSEITKAKSEISAFERETKKAAEQGNFLQRIFTGFSKNIFESVGAVIKFNTAWRVTGAIIEGALLPFTLFIDSLKKGFDFLVNLQQKTADVREVLVQNVEFSREFGENFVLATEAASRLAVDQERFAALIGVETEKFRSVFESAVQSGLFEAVGKIGQDTQTFFDSANKSVSLIISALNAVGVSTKDTRRVTNEINKLLEGQVTQRDKIRIASGLTAEELNKQSLEAQKQGKFAEFLEKIFFAQVKRIETANERFKELNTQVEFFLNRLRAGLVEPTFEKLITLLQDTLKFLKENEKELVLFAKTSGVVFLESLKLLKEFGRLLVNAVGVVFDLIAAFVDLRTSTEKATDAVERLGDKRIIEDFRDGLLAVHRILIAIANVVDFISTGFKRIGIELKRSVKGDPFGLKESLLQTNSPQLKEYFAALKSIEEAEAKHLKHKEDLKTKESDLRFTISHFAGTGNEKEVEERTKRLNDNLEQQKRLDARFLAEQKDFNVKRAAAEAISTRVAMENAALDRDRRIEERFKTHEELKNLAVKQEKDLPKILGFSDKTKADDEAKFNNDRLDRLREAFKDKLEDLTQDTELFIATQRKLEERGILSEKKTTENIQASLDARSEALEKAKDEFIAISRTLSEADPEAVAKFQSQISRQVKDLAGKASKEKIKLSEEQIELTNKLNQEQFDFERKQIIEQSQFILGLEKEAADVGLKLQSEVFAAEIELEKQKLDAQLEIFQQELLAKEENVERQQEVNQKVIKAMRDFNNRVTEINIQRIKAEFAEEEKLRETRLARFKLAQGQAQQIAGLTGDLAGTRSEKFIQEQIAFESQRIVLQQELLENETKLIKIKEEQDKVNKELEASNAKVLAGTISSEERVALANNNLLLDQKSELYRQIGLRIDEINNSLELQNLIIARSQAEEKSRTNFGFQLGRGIFGNIPSARIERVPVPVAVSTEGGLPNLEGATTELKEAFENILVETKPLTEIFRKLTAGGEDTVEALVGIENAVNIVLSGITNAISAFQEGIAQGIGSALGTASQFLKGTIIGEVIGIVGTVVSGISSIFTALARRLAAQIEESIDDILRDFERGFTTLGDTIVRLERQRLEAISKLSGKKGGQKELDELLPGLEDKIAELVQQQKNIQESFEDQLVSLRLNNDSLVEFHEKWKDVVATVKEYLGSFAQGEGLIQAQAKAAEFLSLSLKRIREDFLDQLEDGEKEAIQQAIKLNDLLKEREEILKEIVKLQEEFNKAQFDLLTADAIEARVSGVVARGNAIVQLRKEFEENKKEKEERLKELNTEIAFQARIVAAQKQIFNLASSTAALKARSNVLEENSLQRQLDKFKEIKGVIDGIKQDVNGIFSISPNLLAAAGINPNNTNPAGIAGIAAPPTSVTLDSDDFEKSSEIFRLSSNMAFDSSTNFSNSVSEFNRGVEALSVKASAEVAVAQPVDTSEVQNSMQLLTRSVSDASNKLLSLEPPKQAEIDTTNLDSSLNSLTTDIRDTSDKIKAVQIIDFTAFDELKTSLQSLSEAIKAFTENVNEAKISGIDETIQKELIDFSLALSAATEESKQFEVPELSFTEVQSSFDGLLSSIQDTVAKINEVRFEKVVITTAKEAPENDFNKLIDVNSSGFSSLLDSSRAILETVNKISIPIIPIKESFEGVIAILKELALNTVDLKSLNLKPNIIQNNSVMTISNPTFHINVPEGTDGTKFGRDLLQSWQEEQDRFGFQNR